MVVILITLALAHTDDVASPTGVLGMVSGPVGLCGVPGRLGRICVEGVVP